MRLMVLSSLLWILGGLRESRIVDSKYNKGEKSNEFALIEKEETRKMKILQIPSRLTSDSHSFNISEIIEILAQKLPHINFTEKFRGSDQNVKKLIQSLILNNNSNSQKSKSKTLPCDEQSIYRTIDGSCNNLINPCQGKTEERFQRWLSPQYGNEIDSFRKMRNGEDLPNPRLISRILTGDEWNSRANKFLHHNALFVHWGQFLAHELSLSAFSELEADCCNGIKHAECIPLKVNFEDPYFDRKHCFEVLRSADFHTIRRSCQNTLGMHREQVNEMTSYIDASTVYGTTKEELNELRDQHGATLKSQKSPFEIPIRSSIPCKSSTSNCQKECLLLGDQRSSITTVLMSLHTLWLREHNRLVKLLRSKNWDDEKLFQEVRKLIGAMMQHIIYKEYLPLLLGEKLMNDNNLTTPSNSYIYDSSIDASIMNGFSAAAFRFGHTMVPRRVKKANLILSRSPRLSAEFLSTDDFCSNTTVDPVYNILVGQTEQKAEMIDSVFTKEITNHLFSDPSHHPGNDLLAIDILRGRDHGLPSYNQWRIKCGMTPVHGLKDLKDYFMEGAMEKINAIYGETLSDMDLFVGGINEKPTAEGIIGPTFSCVITEQFRRLKFGDRFWYENLDHPGAFTENQIREISKTTFASLLCRNTETKRIQSKAFLTPSRRNKLKLCREILTKTDLDFKYW